MEDCKLATTPLPTSIQYQPSMDDEAFEDPSLYQLAIGLLMYAAIATHPNITYAINSLSQFNVKPSKKHWNDVKHVFWYLQGTWDIGITFDMDSGYADFIISSFSDSDNGKSFHKKAITGSAILLVGGAIKWIAEKQLIITLSSMEAEYVAANTVMHNSKWTTQFIQELGFQQEDPVNVYVDNQIVIKFAENPKLHKQLQHINKQYHWIQEQVKLGLVTLSWVPTEENLTNIFMKSLPASQFIKHQTYLRMLV